LFVFFLSSARSGDNRKDAEKVGEKIRELVRGLGLDVVLGEYGVGKDQIGVITKRASGKEEGDELYRRVEGLVKELY
jgi:hypothetical protein